MERLWSAGVTAAPTASVTTISGRAYSFRMIKLRRSRSGGGSSPDRSFRSRPRVSRLTGLTRFYRFAPFAGAVLGLALPGACRRGGPGAASFRDARRRSSSGWDRPRALEASVIGADGVEAGARVLFFSLDPADVSVSPHRLWSAPTGRASTPWSRCSRRRRPPPGFTRPDDPGIRVEIPVRCASFPNSPPSASWTSPNG